MEQWTLIAQWAGWPVVVAALLLFGGSQYFRLRNRIDSLKEDNERLAREVGRRDIGEFPIKHYVLFWRASEEEWAHDDWDSARRFVSKFGLTCGFRSEEAGNAKQVTIIGSPRGVDSGVEALLKSRKCRVERLDGRTAEDTAQLLKEKAESDSAFTEGSRRRGY